MSLLNAVYRGILHKYSTCALVVVGSFFLLQADFDEQCNKLFFSMNKGKTYEDVVAKYKAMAEDEE